MATELFAGERSRPWRAARWALLCALAAVAAFLPALCADFVWDDVHVQQGLARTPSALEPFLRAEAPPISWIYRPIPAALAVALYRANDALVGEVDPARAGDPPDRRRARLPHAVSLLVHAANSALVLLLAARLLRGREGAGAGAVVAGLLFALHPAHAENAVWVSAVGDSLAALFLLGALLAAVDAAEGRRAGWVVSGALLLLALLSKESAVAGAVVVPLVALLRAAGPGGRRPSPALPLAASASALGLYLLLRAAAGGGLPGGGLAVPVSLSPKVLAGFAFYVRKALFPWPTTPFVAELPGTAATAGWLLAAAVLCVLAVRAWRSADRLPLLCALWFAVAVGPFLLLTLDGPPTRTVAAERYLYFPSAALALAAAGVAAGAHRHRRALAAVAAALLLACGLSCWRAAAVWATPVDLWGYVTSRTDGGRFPAPWVNLGRALEGAGQPERARRALLRAIEPGMPPDAEAVGNALTELCRIESVEGWALLEAERWGEAETRLSGARDFCLRAAAADPRAPDSALNAGVAGMGLFLARRGRDKTADFRLLEEACGRIEGAAPAGGRAAWAARQLERCRQLRGGPPGDPGD